MNKPFRITYSEKYLQYSLGDMHPMNPRRIAPVMSLLDDVLRDMDEFTVIGPNYINPSIIEMAHSNYRNGEAAPSTVAFHPNSALHTLTFS